MSWDDVVKLALAALFAATSALFVTWLKSIWDEERAGADKFSDTVRSAADLAAEYWLKPAADPGLELLEAKLVGAQTYLAHFRLVAVENFGTADRTWLVGTLADLYDAMTEGQFKVKGRAADPSRAEDCQRIAAEIAIYIRSSYRRSMRTSAQIKRVLRLGQP